MSRPNFIVKVPSVQLRHRPRPKKKIKTSKADNYAELETIDETNNFDTKNSSYYSLNVADNSDVKLKVIETYDEFLNLRDLDKIYWKSSSNGLNSNVQSDEGIFLLKQICADLNLDVARSEKEYVKIPRHELRTAIIAQRILDTEEQIANSRKNSGTGFSGESLRRNSFNRSVRSLGKVDQVPRTILSKTLSNLTSKFIIKQKTPTIAGEAQVNLVGPILPVLSQSCNTQTGEVNCCEDIVRTFFRNRSQHKTVVNRCVQSPSVQCEDKFVNTTNSLLYPNEERSTQMYEHITENDLLCMEWIDKNLFRVPVNPNTVIVDQKLRDTSEFTCWGTTFFEQELNWEMEALC